MVNDMAKAISCPNCTQTVELHARYCEHCGVDLALAAAAAERSLGPLSILQDGLPLSPEVLVPRIGDTMLEMGILTPGDLQREVEYHLKRSTEGRPILLGQAMLELGLVDRETLDQVVTIQIFQLQNALQNANQSLEQRVRERTIDLQHALARLSEINQLKSNFIANISHELRTPLTHIKGYIDLLVDNSLGPLTEQQADALGVLQRSEQRLERLIEDLIQFSLASRGELGLVFSPIDLSRLIQRVVEQSQLKAQSAEVMVEASVPENLPQVLADEDKINWVIAQLVDNAIKFSQKSGRVIVSAKSDLDQVIVAIQDQGIGIPPDRLSEIFEPFHQLDGSSTRRYGGTGLGLALVRRILDAHHQSIQVDFESGMGHPV